MATTELIKLRIYIEQKTKKIKAAEERLDLMISRGDLDESRFLSTMIHNLKKRVQEAENKLAQGVAV